MELFKLVSQTDIKSELEMVLWASMSPTRSKFPFTREFRFQFMKLRNLLCMGGPGLSSISLARWRRMKGNHPGTF